MKVYLKMVSGLMALSLFYSCAGPKNIAVPVSKAVTKPPCHFQAGRLNISWVAAYNPQTIKFEPKYGADSLPRHFMVFKINTASLYSFLKSVDGYPYTKRYISMPVNRGYGCMLFHLEPSHTMSAALQKKFPNLKSWKGFSQADSTYQLRMTFDGNSVRAAILHGNETELLSPWPAKSGFIYYLFYNKKDVRGRHVPFKSY